jgi:predicted O-methyltransferase YrrM
VNLRNLLKSQIEFENQYLYFWETKVDHVKGWLSKEEGFVLYKCASRSRIGTSAIEIGSYEGKSTLCISFGLSSVKLISIDPHTGDISEAEKGEAVSTLVALKSNLSRGGMLERVEIIVSRSDDAVSAIRNVNASLIFIDGWHTAEQVSRDISNYMTLATQDCIVVVDDYYDAEVSKGILMSRHLLPSFTGSVGKLGIFGADKYDRELLGIHKLIRNDRIDLAFLKFNRFFRRL